MIDNYIYIIVALLPLTSLMLVTQTNPYHALVVRAILGAVAALVYAVLGAADVALTEALVGTMLAVTLYIIAVRSSLVMQLGILKSDLTENDLNEIIPKLKKAIAKYYLHLELVEYSNLDELKQALSNKDIHAYYSISQQFSQLNIRIERLFEILEAELHSSKIVFIHVNHAANKQKLVSNENT